MEKKYNKHLWFKPKGYTHFTSKLTTKDLGFVASYVSTPENIKKHKFHPLIHRTLVIPRLKFVAGKDKKSHYETDFKTGKKIRTTKFREIYYANHLDAHIYSYYCNKILTPLYETQLASNPLLSDCICAYRRIPITGLKRNKCNIDFANDVFQAIKVRETELVAMSFDIKGFFDSLNHKRLKQAWYNLLSRDEKSLPLDHYKVFNSLTKFVFVDYYDILKEFNIKHPNDVIEKDIPKFLINNSDIKTRIIDNGLLKKNTFRDLANNMRGIPQGTPISAFLANLYLLEFDKTIFNKVVIELSGIYKRYSDDIIVVCEPQYEKDVEKLIIEEISKYKVEIQQAKTQKTFFTDKGKLKHPSKPLQYLGFEYDGKKILLKSSSLSKYHRKMKKHIRYKAFLAGQQKRKKQSDISIHRKSIYKGYSHYGSRTRNPLKRNYFSYAYTASKIMNEPAIKRQLSKSWQTINSEINRYTMKYKLDKKSSTK